MSAVVQVAVHPSQFPAQVRRDLLASLRARRVNHKFHYDSLRQTQQWLALHQVLSPSRTDPNCAAIYDQGFAAAVSGLNAGRVHLVGLGCGGGGASPYPQTPSSVSTTTTFVVTSLTVRSAVLNGFFSGTERRPRRSVRIFILGSRHHGQDLGD